MAKFRKGDIICRRVSTYPAPWRRKIFQVYSDRYKVSPVNAFGVKEFRHYYRQNYVDVEYRLDVIATMKDMRNDKV